jgi:hypothetical protein
MISSAEPNWNTSDTGIRLLPTCRYSAVSTFMKAAGHGLTAHQPYNGRDHCYLVAFHLPSPLLESMRGACDSFRLAPQCRSWQYACRYRQRYKSGPRVDILVHADGLSILHVSVVSVRCLLELMLQVSHFVTFWRNARECSQFSTPYHSVPRWPSKRGDAQASHLHH